jgi:hypothetical protein
MEVTKPNSFSGHKVVSVIVFLILTFFLCIPMPYGSYGFFYFGVIPAPFAHWILVTLLYVAFIIYMGFYYDPYRGWTKKLEEEQRLKVKN